MCQGDRRFPLATVVARLLRCLRRALEIYVGARGAAGRRREQQQFRWCGGRCVGTRARRRQSFALLVVVVVAWIAVACRHHSS